MSAHIGSAHRAHVMTAKAGLVGFTRGLAHDLAADKITANCVVPGAIETARPAAAAKPAHHLTHGTITGERGKPQDVAAMVRFLAGPGGRFVTGQTIHVNGGAYLRVVVVQSSGRGQRPQRALGSRRCRHSHTPHFCADGSSPPGERAQQQRSR